MNAIHIQAPLDEQTVNLLHSGDLVLISGVLFGARDAAHARLVETLAANEPPPIPLSGQMIYYVGPAPARSGQVIGPAGPTTSGRMDPYTIPLLGQGVKGFIGKGYRSPDVKAALIKYRAIYLATFGGAAALLSRQIIACQVAAYPELGTEAIYKFSVENFPAVVVNDVYGADAYTTGREKFHSRKI